MRDLHPLNPLSAYYPLIASAVSVSWCLFILWDYSRNSSYWCGTGEERVWRDFHTLAPVMAALPALAAWKVRRSCVIPLHVPPAVLVAVGACALLWIAFRVVQ
jgi:hypothetical protein